MIAGGPGTGKTTTVARVLALLEEQALAQGRPPPLVALAAPTGKAAARLEEAVRAEAPRMGLDDDLQQRLRGFRGMTLHRLLGFNPGNRTRSATTGRTLSATTWSWSTRRRWWPFRLMARLLEAIRPDARLILVGDPEQLASVEAGAVLGDIVGPASAGLCMGATARGSPGVGDPGSRGRVAGGHGSAIGDGRGLAASRAPPPGSHRRFGQGDTARRCRRRAGSVGRGRVERPVDPPRGVATCGRGLDAIRALAVHSGRDADRGGEVR